MLAQTAAGEGAGLETTWTIPRAAAMWNVDPHSARAGLRRGVANGWIVDHGMRSQARLISLPRRRRNGEMSNPDGWSRLVVDHLLGAPTDELAEPDERRVAGLVATLIRHAGHPVWGYSQHLGLEHWEALLAASIGALKLGDRTVHAVGVQRVIGIGRRRLATVANDWMKILGDSGEDRPKMSDADGVLMQLAAETTAAKLTEVLDRIATGTGAVDRAAEAEQRRAEHADKRRRTVSAWRVHGHVDYLLGRVGKPGGSIDAWIERAIQHLSERSIADDDQDATMTAVDQLAAFDDGQRDQLRRSLAGKVDQSADGDRIFDSVIETVGRCPARPAPLRQWGGDVQAEIGGLPVSATTRRRLRHRLAGEIAERRGASQADARKAARAIVPD